MNESVSTAVGLLVAPLVPAVIGAVLTPIIRSTFNTDIVSVLGLSFVFYVFSLAASLLFGAPLFLMFRRYSLVRWWSALVSGFIVGAIVAVCIRLPNTVQPEDFLVMAPEGAVAGLVFWAIWRLGTGAQPRAAVDRPEKRGPATEL